MSEQSKDNDSRRNNYQKVLERLRSQLTNLDKLNAAQFREWLDKSADYVQAACDMTRDELELIASYVRRDVASFADSYRRNSDAFKDSPTYQALESGFWHWLLELTDKTKCEWVEIADDLKHHGEYHSGEVVGLGTLTCENCGHQHTIDHPEVLGTCPECDGDEFIRVPLEP